MKTKIFFLLTIFFSSWLFCQSSIVYDLGTTIDVGNGADVCAGTITVNGTYSGGGTFCTGALPVELVSFNSIVSDNKVELNWITATEVNNYGFEVERGIGQKAIGNSAWEKIGFVQGNGNSNSPKEYRFTDNTTTSGLYAYRLKQIDNDGIFKYSSDVEVTVGQFPNDYSLNQNYPNPFNPETKIRYSIPIVETHGGASVQNVLLKVYDMLGREVATLVNEVQEAGTYEVSFNGKSFTSGAYFYRFQSGNYVKINKMTLIK